MGQNPLPFRFHRPEVASLDWFCSHQTTRLFSAIPTRPHPFVVSSMQRHRGVEGSHCLAQKFPVICPEISNLRTHCQQKAGGE
jgi:hypothetical protein